MILLLQESEKENRYILTAMYMTSKYPEDIPIVNTRSESVIDGLLIIIIFYTIFFTIIIFNILSFPREIQCDLGTFFF